MDRALILRVKQGDKIAFDTLIEQHRELMFRYAYLIVRDAARAEDVTQEAVLQIYKHFATFDHSKPFRPWAIGIIRNIARNQNRAWGRYKHMLIRWLTQRDSEQNNVETLTQQQEQAATLHEVVSQLRDSYQDVIFARYFLGLSVEDSAEALGIATGTVKSRSHRALKQLRRLIERDYPYLVEYPNE